MSQIILADASGDTSANLADKLATKAAEQEAAKVELLKRLPIVEGRRYFVVGDLHGCYDAFMRLVDAAGVDKSKDIVLCTGDLIDRGPDSVKCIGLLNEPWFMSVAGNHEQMLMMAVIDPNFDWSWWDANGGGWAREFKDTPMLLSLAEKVGNLPLAIVVGEGEERFNVIHAEFYGSDAALEDTLENPHPSMGIPLSITWGRELMEGKVDPSCHEDLSLTFVGHNITQQVGKIGQHVYIDTGSFIAERRNDHSTYGITMIEPKTAQIWRSTPKPE